MIVSVHLSKARLHSGKEFRTSTMTAGIANPFAFRDSALDPLGELMHSAPHIPSWWGLPIPPRPDLAPQKFLDSLLHRCVLID